MTGSRPAIGGDRALARVLFTDVVDSTEKAAELGDAVADLVERHHRSAGPARAIAGDRGGHCGGRLLRDLRRPGRAIRCARPAVEAVRPLGIEVRAGVDTGEVETIDGEGGRHGRASSAPGSRHPPEPPRCSVSSTVKDLVAGSGLAFEDAGERELKGVPDRWHLYRVLGAPQGGDPSGPRGLRRDARRLHRCPRPLMQPRGRVRDRATALGLIGTLDRPRLMHARALDRALDRAHAQPPIRRSSA